MYCIQKFINCYDVLLAFSAPENFVTQEKYMHVVDDVATIAFDRNTCILLNTTAKNITIL
jgi:hypothetical protein